jgi:cell division transport system permease protein
MASFARNAWMTVAAIAIMTITLMIISATLIARNVMSTVVSDVVDKVSMSVYLKQELSAAEVGGIADEMGALDSVASVAMTSPTEANEAAIAKMIEKENITNPDVIEALREAPNKLPWTINVKIFDLNDTVELEDFVYNSAIMEGKLDAKPPSFSGSKRESINTIAAVAGGVEKFGLIAGVVFMVIAVLVIFNTIRMAIFSRREEIYMMKLIGAGKSFIRGPFVIEAMMYGFVAAGITCGAVWGVMMFLSERIGATIEPTVGLLREWWWVAGLGLVAVGSLIGIVSAMLAAKKYLK